MPLSLPRESEIGDGVIRQDHTVWQSWPTG